MQQSIPCKHAVNAAVEKDAMLSPVAFSISTSFLSTNGKLPVPSTASKQLTPVLLYRAACLCALLF